jgi:nicotinamidase-related amidase
MEVEVPDYNIESEVEVDPDRFVLLILDMQNDFVHPDGALYNPDAEETIDKIARFARRAREAGVPVWHTQDTHRKGDTEFDIWGEHCRKDTWGWEIVDKLTPQEDDLVFQKPRYDAFYGTDLDQQLREHDREGLIMAGTVANICVHYTAASAGHRFMDVVLPIDLISALDEFDYHSTLRQVNWLYQAKLVEQDDLTFPSN